MMKAIQETFVIFLVGIISVPLDLKVICDTRLILNIKYIRLKMLELDF